MGKKLIFGIALLLMAGGVFAANNNYYLNIATHTVVVASTATWTIDGIAWPQLQVDVQWRKLILANTGPHTQTVTFYENVTSTSAAGEIFMRVVLSTATYADRTKVINFDNKWTGYYEAECSNLGVMKSTVDSDVYMTLFYK